jgi:hypothetical protein
MPEFAPGPVRIFRVASAGFGRSMKMSIEWPIRAIFFILRIARGAAILAASP